MADSVNAGAKPDRANLTLGLGIAAVAGLLLAIFATGNDDQPEWLWFISPVLGIAAVAAGLTSRQGGKIPVRAVIGMALGALLILNAVLWAVGVFS